MRKKEGMRLRLGATLMAMLAVALFSCAQASAAQWLHNGVAPGEQVAATWTGKVQISDTEAGVAVECEDAGEGTVAPGKTGTESASTLSKCVILKGSGSCVELKGAKAVNLPWQGELTTSGETIEDRLFNSTGNPGFEFECKTFIGLVRYECTASSLTATMANATEGVTATLPEQKVTCAIKYEEGLKEVRGQPGEVEGTQTIIATHGGTLTVGPGQSTAGQNPVWMANGLQLKEPLSTKLTGTMKFINKVGTSWECASEGEGSAGAGNLGKVSNFTFKSCKLSSNAACEKLESIKTASLPWQSELGMSNEVIENLMFNVGFVFICKRSTGDEENSCSFKVLRGNTANTAEGVAWRFKSESAGCPYEGQIEGTLTFTNNEGRKLEAKAS